VTFGGPAGPRHIPGLGTSLRPEIADLHEPDDIVLVPEQDAVRMCQRLLERYGLLSGGSTGSVASAVERYPIPPNSTVVAISPDFGDRYLDTLYDPEWVDARFTATADLFCSARSPADPSEPPATTGASVPLTASASH
jgi:N-(2-amino-2-carboxyethyl)-L-glutamate synthase